MERGIVPWQKRVSVARPRLELEAPVARKGNRGHDGFGAGIGELDIRR